VDRKAECGQLNPAHVTTKIRKKKLKHLVHLLRYRFKIREGNPNGTRKTVEERICERDAFYVCSKRARE